MKTTTDGYPINSAWLLVGEGIDGIPRDMGIGIVLEAAALLAAVCVHVTMVP